MDTRGGPIETALAAPAPTKGGSMLDVASARSAQEVQAAMVIARKFPRDTDSAFAAIMRACKRRSLAENAVYTFPRGGTTVSGPSIRLAEVLAQSWGNIDFGLVELERSAGRSQMMSYAWDLETNTRQVRVFDVPHVRWTRGGGTALDDPRDVYEMTANQGARRLRACILGIIPGDIVDAALTACEETMRSDQSEPLADRVRKMAAAFGEFGVTAAMIEKRLGHVLRTTTESELVGLRKIYAALRDNMASVEGYFHVEQTGGTRTEKLAEQMSRQREAGIDSEPNAASEVAAATPAEPPRRRGRPRKQREPEPVPPTPEAPEPEQRKQDEPEPDTDPADDSIAYVPLSEIRSTQETVIATEAVIQSITLFDPKLPNNGGRVMLYSGPHTASVLWNHAFPTWARSGARASISQMTRNSAGIWTIREWQEVVR